MWARTSSLDCVVAAGAAQAHGPTVLPSSKTKLKLVHCGQHPTPRQTALDSLTLKRGNSTTQTVLWDNLSENHQHRPFASHPIQYHSMEATTSSGVGDYSVRPSARCGGPRGLREGSGAAGSGMVRGAQADLLPHLPTAGVVDWVDVQVHHRKQRDFAQRGELGIERARPVRVQQRDLCPGEFRGRRAHNERAGPQVNVGDDPLPRQHHQGHTCVRRESGWKLRTETGRTWRRAGNTVTGKGTGMVDWDRLRGVLGGLRGVVPCPICAAAVLHPPGMDMQVDGAGGLPQPMRKLLTSPHPLVEATQKSQINTVPTPTVAWP